MPRNRTGWTARAEYVPLRGLLSLLQRLPWNLSRGIARRLVRAILQAMPKRRRLVLSQLRAAFPDKSEAALRMLADRSLDSLGDGLAMFSRIGVLTTPQMDRLVETVGFEHLDAALEKGLGAITFTAHYG